MSQLDDHVPVFVGVGEPFFSSVWRANIWAVEKSVEYVSGTSVAEGYIVRAFVEVLQHSLGSEFHSEFCPFLEAFEAFGKFCSEEVSCLLVVP